MADPLPLSALLSQALVAFTIEFDNEFEHQTPHRTTNHASTGEGATGPWLVSMVFWMKFLRFVPDDGITVPDFRREAGLTNDEAKRWLTRLGRWWGYVVVERSLIRPTSGGRKALQVWRPLTGIIEKRWRERFGSQTIDELGQSMQALVDQLNPDLPDCLPILGYHMMSAGPDPEQRGQTRGAAEYALPALLSKVLLALAVQYERESQLSFAISANALRLANEDGVPVRDLPRLSGVSKEAIAMAVKRLEEDGFAVVEGRVKMLLLTAEGQRARNTYNRLVWGIEKRWEASFGAAVGNLRRSLEPLAYPLQPYPDGWRAAVRKPDVLPHYPMILHRGGFPDGS